MTFIINILECVVAHPAMILVGIILCAFVYFLYQFIFQSKSGRNPFYKDLRRSPKPLIIDQADRDKVLKEGFAAKKVPDDLDAIVIGSGIGGLGAAAILSKAGKKVLVLEQHDQAGGCCHTFIEKGFEFDIGIHYIGEMRNNTVARLLLEQLTEGQLCWQDLLDEMDLVAIGESGKHKLYPHVCAGYDRWKEGILEKFPDEKEAVNKFVSLLQGVRRNMMGLIMMKTIPYWLSKIVVKTGLFHKLTSYFKYSDQGLQDVLDSLTDNKDLKAVLSYSFGDYGTLPKDASFATHASLLSHYIFGGSYPRGGASEIPFHMIPVIEKSGGKVLVRAPVSQIICREGKAVGVKVHKKSGDQEIYAPLIISDAGILNTFTRLLPKEIASKSSIQKMLTKKKVKVGLAGLQLFVGLDGTTEELGLKSQNIWAFSGNDTNRLVQEYLDLSRDEALEADVPLLFISFPSAKDSTFNDRFPGKSVATIVSFSNFEWFKDWETERVQKRGAEYESIKQVIGRRMWNQVLGYYPQLADKVEYFEVGTPLTNNFYINSTQGEIYGLDHTKERFGNPEVAMNLRAESGIPGLLLSGQDILSDGLMGALFGGLLCASQALNRNVYQDLVNLKKNISKDK